MDKLLTHALVASSEPSTRTSSGPEQRLHALKRKDHILSCQRRLFDSYRADQFPNPQAFKDNLGLVLSQYPDDVIDLVTDPRTGLQRKHTWPPAIAEIVAACDAAMADRQRDLRYKNWGKADAAMQALEAPREDRLTLDELKAKYGENWGLKTVDRPERPRQTAPPWSQIVETYMVARK